MARHIGIVAGSAEGAALCYRTICLEAPVLMGEHNHPEITLNSVPLAEHMRYILANDWKGLAEVLLDSARRLAVAGADFAICPDNTYHQAFPYLIPGSPIPWIHIAEAVAEEAQRLGYLRLGILGSKYLAEGPVYPDVLVKHGIECEIPDQLDRERINSIILDELVKGVFPEASRLYLNEVMTALKGRGCDAVVLGCTEIPLIFYPGWQAEVDGHRVRILLTDFLLRGVYLPPGTHSVEMRYTATTARNGSFVSLLSLGIIGALFFIGRRKTKLHD